MRGVGAWRTDYAAAGAPEFHRCDGRRLSAFPGLARNISIGPSKQMMRPSAVWALLCLLAVGLTLVRSVGRLLAV